jgi:hypothetical protein
VKAPFFYRDVTRPWSEVLDSPTPELEALAATRYVGADIREAYWLGRQLIEQRVCNVKEFKVDEHV